MKETLSGIKNQVTDYLQSRYDSNKPLELTGTPSYSDIFFDEIKSQGIIPAFNGLVQYFADHGKKHTRLHAVNTLFNSGVLAVSGLTSYVQNIKEITIDEHYSLAQRLGLGLYALTVGGLFASWGNTAEDDHTYAVQRNQNDEIVLLHGQGHMSKKEVDRAIKRGLV